MTYLPQVRAAWLAECCKADIEIDDSADYAAKRKHYQAHRDEINKRRRILYRQKKAAKLCKA